MPIPTNKEELLQAIEDTYTKLKKDLAPITADLAELIELEGHAKGTQMSVCNLVAYLIGWGELVLKWDRLKQAGKEVDFPETGFKWNELGLLAQKFYKDYENLSYPQLLEKLDETVEQLSDLIQKRDNNQLYGEPWYDKWPMGRMIQLNTSSPYKNARTRVRKWKRGRGF